MFQIFESGGITGLSEAEYKGWRVKLKKELEDISTYKDFKHKVDIIDPTMYFGLDDDQVVAMAWLIRKVKSSDLVVINYNAPNSLGAAMEVAIAKENDIPVIGINSENYQIHPWLLLATDCMFESVESAAKYIASYYLT